MKWCLTALTLAVLAVSFAAMPATGERYETKTVGQSKIISLGDKADDTDNDGDEVVIFRGGQIANAYSPSLSFEVVEPEDDDETVRLLVPVKAAPGADCRRAVRRSFDALERRNRYEVCFGDLVPISEDNAEELYKRIEKASRRACPNLGAAPLAEVYACRSDATERAVYDLGQPPLTDLHRDETNQRPNSIYVGPNAPL